MINFRDGHILSVRQLLFGLLILVASGGDHIERNIFSHYSPVCMCLTCFRCVDSWFCFFPTPLLSGYDTLVLFMIFL